MSRPMLLTAPGPVPADCTLEALEALSEPLPPHDVLVVGDGSGSTWERAIGWAAVIWDKRTDAIAVRFGGQLRGTVNIAEALSLLNPLQELASQPRRGVLSVACVTDSEVTQQLLTPGKPRPAANAGLWAWAQALVREGLAITPIHRPRNSSPWQCYVDALSKSARKLLERPAATQASTSAIGQVANIPRSTARVGL